MQHSMLIEFLANAVLVLHVAIVLFIVGGLVLVVAGNVLHWHWVNDLRFRLSHLAAIGFVVAETWLGWTCPLTTLEMYLRSLADTPTYAGGFIEYWLQRFLYYSAPPWVFLLAYSIFGLLVLASWWYFPPSKRGSDKAVFRKKSK